MLAIIVAIALTIYGVALYVHSYRNTAKEPVPSLPPQPFPALWQKNFSGTPTTVEATANGTLFTAVYGNTSFSLKPVWLLYAIQLATGRILWSHNLTFSSQGNLAPELYARNREVYFISGGTSLWIDGNFVPGGGLFAIPFNETTGINGTTRAPQELNFFPLGDYAIQGDFLHVVSTVLGGWRVNVEAWSMFGSNSTPLNAWQTFLNAPNGYNSSAGRVFADSSLILIPLWNLIGLKASDGTVLFNSSYRSLHSDPIDVDNGMLLNSTFYYISEIQGKGYATSIHLIGLSVPSLSTVVNSTIFNLSYSVSPVSADVLGNNIVVMIDQENYAVTTLSGQLLRKSADLHYANPSGKGSISPGRPLAVLSNGNWLLSSVVTQTGTGGTAVQYFEGISPSNGSVMWLHQFPFHWSKNTWQFYPPYGWSSVSVLVIVTSGSNLVYRWRSSVGCAIV